MTPVATLYHFDMPAVLENKYGGWLGDQIVEDFTEYARIVYSHFGDRVKHWFTINEPLVECTYHYPKTPGYFKNISIPDVEQPFYCGRNILLAHASAYRLGKLMIPGDSLITFKASGGYKIPLTNSTADAQATQRAWDFEEGWFADPVYLTGDWPSSVNEYVSGFLPAFTEDQKSQIRGSGDFFAEDAYTAQFYAAPDQGIDACIANVSNPLFPVCTNVSYSYPAVDGSWLIGAAADPGASWLHQTAEWVPDFLRYINRTWPAPHGIAISEFGFAEPFEEYKTALGDILYDPIRSQYYHQFMESLLTVIDEGIHIMGCWAWSFVDNLEWNSGYGTHFGLQYVNFSDPALERHYKASFFEYADMYNSYVER